MTTLLTGGTGKTGLILAKLLADAGRPVLLTSRKGVAPAPYTAVKFDWYDQSTFANPFKADPSIDRVYIVSPADSYHPGPIVKPFLDLAISKGVKRFVLLSGCQTGPDRPLTGEIHKLLLGLDINVEVAVLRPTWFQENFGTNFVYTIREYNEFSSSVGDGVVPFVSTQDIAQSAFDCLTKDTLGKEEVFIYGPELISYDDAAKLLSSVLNREIKHKKLSGDEMKNIYTSVGLPEEIAGVLTWLEDNSSKGKDRELLLDENTTKTIGKHSLLEYFQENKELWVKA